MKSTEFSGLILSRTGVTWINLYDSRKSNPEPDLSDMSSLKLTLSFFFIVKLCSEKCTGTDIELCDILALQQFSYIYNNTCIYLWKNKFILVL